MGNLWAYEAANGRVLRACVCGLARASISDKSGRVNLPKPLVAAEGPWLRASQNANRSVRRYESRSKYFPPGRLSKAKSRTSTTRLDGDLHRIRPDRERGEEWNVHIRQFRLISCYSAQDYRPNNSNNGRAEENKNLNFKCYAIGSVHILRARWYFNTDTHAHNVTYQTAINLILAVCSLHVWKTTALFEFMSVFKN